MLARPSRTQYTSRKFSQRANSSSVSAAPAPYSSDINPLMNNDEDSLPVPTSTSQPYPMMDVSSAHGDIVEWPEVVMNAGGQSAHPGKGKKKSNCRQEKAPLRPVWDVLVQQRAQPGAMQQPRHSCRDHGDQDRKST